MREQINFNPDYGTQRENSIIKVIGVGGGGGNAVRSMYTEGIVGVDFMICNTDKKALEENPVPNKLILGKSGLGAGANPEIACQYAEDSADEIKKFIGDETKLLFITAGMGKGTGTGATPVIARIAQEMGILTVGVVTFPYKWETAKVARRAEAGIAELKKHVDSIIIVHNENILKYYGDDDFNIAYQRVDNVLQTAVKCIAELITINLDQNIDFNDIRSTLQNSGAAMMGIGESNAEDRVEEAFTEAFDCPLLAQEEIQNARKFLFCISYGPDRKLKISELQVLTKKFESILSEEAELIWGRTEDKSLGDKIKLSIIITDYESNPKKANVPQVTSIQSSETMGTQNEEVQESSAINNGPVEGVEILEPKIQTVQAEVEETPTATVTEVIVEETVQEENTPTASKIDIFPIEESGDSFDDDFDNIFNNDKVFSDYVDTPAILQAKTSNAHQSSKVVVCEEKETYQISMSSSSDDSSLLFGGSLAD